MEFIEPEARPDRVLGVARDLVETARLELKNGNLFGFESYIYRVRKLMSTIEAFELCDMLEEIYRDCHLVSHERLEQNFAEFEKFWNLYRSSLEK